MTEMQESRPQRAGCKTVKKRMEVGKTDCLCLSLLPDAHYLLIPSLNLKPRIQEKEHKCLLTQFYYYKVDFPDVLQLIQDYCCFCCNEDH
jgi:hypothetical protein